ncbi:MAG: hypothetical protein EXR77_07340 [Myxococcales bacterium]|nr:hypothetical protein [Myxococcales bacterium]
MASHRLHAEKWTLGSAIILVKRSEMISTHSFNNILQFLWNFSPSARLDARTATIFAANRGKRFQPPITGFAPATFVRAGTAMRQIRFLPSTYLVEVSRRTLNGKFLFDPVENPHTAEAFHAIIARAQQEHGVDVHAYFVMSNHYHALYSSLNPDALADFLRDVHSEMARYSNTIHELTGPVFAGRCHIKPVFADEATTTNRLAYIMGQAVKIKGSRWTIDDWPGANTNRALMYGDKLVGRHFDNARKILESRRKGGPQADDDYTSRPEVVLTVLPCWKHLSVDDQRVRYRALAKAAAERFGEDGVTSQHVDSAGEYRDYLADLPRSAPPASPLAPVAVAASVAAGSAQSPIGQVREPVNRFEAVVAGKILSSQGGEHAGCDSIGAASQAAHGNSKEIQARPKPKKGGRTKAHYVHAANKADEAAFDKAYREARTQHREAQEELRIQAKQALMGKAAKLVLFPPFTFGCAVRIGGLRQELGLADLALNP